MQDHLLCNLLLLADTLKNIFNLVCIQLKEIIPLAKVPEYFLLLHFQEKFVNTSHFIDITIS